MSLIRRAQRAAENVICACFDSRRTARHAAESAAYHIISPPFEITIRADYHLRSCARFSVASRLLLRIAGRSTVMHRSAGMFSSPSSGYFLLPLRSSRRVGSVCTHGPLLLPATHRRRCVYGIHSRSQKNCLSLPPHSLTLPLSLAPSIVPLD